MSTSASGKGTPSSFVVKNVAVVGTGVIGASWASLFLARGLSVTAYDPQPGAELRLREAVTAHWPALTSLGLAPNASQDKLIFCQSVEEAVANADFVQESGPERTDFKLALFKTLDASAPAHCMIASSSSGLPSSSFVGHCEHHPERVLIGHPFNPPHLIPLVEVVPGSHTSQQTIDNVIDFYKSLGKTPILLRKEVKGFVANRLQAALWKEAFSLVTEGVASAEDVDTAISQGPGLRWALLGPFMNMHLGGGSDGLPHFLEHIGPPMEDWWADQHPVVLDSETKKTLVASCDEQLAKLDLPKMVAERDAALINLINDKRTKSELP